MARPTKYTQELAGKICELISTTDRGLRSICKELDISTWSIVTWLSNGKHPEFTIQYARAKEMQADVLADQIIELSDNCRLGKSTVDKPTGLETTESDNIQRSRLQVDARKWVASKLAPKKYGEKLDVTSGGIRLGKDLADEEYKD